MEERREEARESKRRRIHMNDAELFAMASTAVGSQPLTAPQLVSKSSIDPNKGLYPKSRTRSSKRAATSTSLTQPSSPSSSELSQSPRMKSCMRSPIKHVAGSRGIFECQQSSGAHTVDLTEDSDSLESLGDGNNLPGTSCKPSSTSRFLQKASTLFAPKFIKDEDQMLASKPYTSRSAGGGFQKASSLPAPKLVDDEDLIYASKPSTSRSAGRGFQKASALLAPKLVNDEGLTQSSSEKKGVFAMLLDGQKAFQEKLKTGDKSATIKPAIVQKRQLAKWRKMKSNSSMDDKSEPDVEMMDSQEPEDPLSMILKVKEEKSEGKGYFDCLPDEVLVNILCRLPVHDLFMKCSLVCKRWQNIVNDEGFIPWKKLYYRIQASGPMECPEYREVKKLMNKHGMKDISTYLPSLVKYMGNFKPGWSRYSRVSDCLKQHTKYKHAYSLMEERFPDLIVEKVPNPFSLVAALCVVCDSVAELSEMVQLVVCGNHEMQALDLLELLYAITTFLLCFKKIQRRNVWNGMHYRLYYALYQYENSGTNSAAQLHDKLTGGGQQSLVKYSDSDMQLTHEQLEICKFDPLPGQTAKIVAFAGTGKTTTLMKYTQLRPNKSFLLIVFNKSVQTHAEKVFPGNVTCRTSHGLAYQGMRVATRFKGKYLYNLKVKHVLKLVEEKKGMNMYHMAKFVLDTIENFMASADEFITTAHTPTQIMSQQGKMVQLEHKDKMGISEKAQSVWDKMIDPYNKSAPLPHDAYLKMYQLSKPKLTQYDVILVDEAQDITPAFTDIVMRQSQTKILVGDPNQQIYSFRGAVNAMQLIPATHTFYLTQSFRFGPEIAFVANCALEYLKDERKTLVGNNKPSFITGKMVGKVCIIARTNFCLFKEAVKLCCFKDPKPWVYLVGGEEGYGYDRILQIYFLMLPKHERSPLAVETLRKSDFIGKFDNLGKLEAYAEQTHDQEMLGKIKIVRCYTHAIPHHINAIRSRLASSEFTADFLLSTAHKSKGLEFDTVKLTADFCTQLMATTQPSPFYFEEEEDFFQAVLFDLQAGMEGNNGRGELPAQRPGPSSDEENLLYVALTRAKKSLCLTEVLVAILKACGETFFTNKLTSSLTQASSRCLETNKEFIPKENCALTLCKPDLVYSDGTHVSGGLISSEGARQMYSLKRLYGSKNPPQVSSPQSGNIV